ncbi:nucleoside hydrolase [Histidinibacterium lentulum]|uniref:Nucleoside hydrolase n=1 Tax=Histidinibacterium lentulum TaxID=2480588 RepID=A0A3N2QRJ2_9RHOB|nr:nucleoside hydrolase [Histidinibacterium lentulum]ROT97828.1 nucleoside hydrolase [Histidinibacterium lentulum]
MPQKVLFDTDPGVDDAAALLFLHRAAALDLVGITTVFGNADIATCTRNALFLKALFGIEAPVAEGAGRDLRGRAGPVPVHVHGENGLGDAPLSGIDLPRSDPRPAHQLIAETLRAHPGEVRVIAVGRLTNLALALDADPGLVELARDIVLMGGAFAGGNGNVTPAAEANMIGDPDAADIVFGAPWKVTAVGLDVTRNILLPRRVLADWADSGDPGLEFLAAAKRHYVAYHDRFGVDGCYVHDPAAVAYALDPGLFEITEGPVRVIRDGIAMGQTIQADPAIPYPPGSAWEGRPVQNVARQANASAILDLFEETIAVSAEV